MRDLEYGTVKLFDNRPGKRFGFLCVINDNGQTGEELFFHYNNGQFVDVKDATIVFIGPIMQKDTRLATPAKGDTIAFRRAPAAKGDVASPWTYGKLIAAARHKLSSLPFYRVVKISSYYGKNDTTPIWEGRSISELSAKHPKQRRFNRTIDSLEAGTADGGDMYWHFEIQQRQADGSWVVSKDPRVFLCCVPRKVFSEHGSHTMAQGHCLHGN